MGKYQVVAMAVVTGCCDNQTRFKETPSMDSLGVVFNDIVFRYIISPRHNFSLAVAFSA
jgi:hypothetical protein